MKCDNCGATLNDGEQWRIKQMAFKHNVSVDDMATMCRVCEQVKAQHQSTYNYDDMDQYTET